MRTTHIFLGMLAIAGGAVTAASGCSSDPDPGGTGGDTSTTSSQGGAGGMDTTSVTTTSTGGTGGGTSGDGNDSFDEAEMVELGTQFDGEIDPGDDVDFYEFQGQAGQSVIVATDAKPNSDPFADGYVDLVVELYDENQQLIATNDDPIPRTTQDSTLITDLPAAGTYYLRVMDFCFYAQDVLGMDPCGGLADITEPAYAAVVSEIDYTETGNVDEDEGGIMEYGDSMGDTNSGYFAPLVHGTFDADTDVDTYEFELPTDYTITNTNGGRPTANFELFPTGTDGNGSTAPVGDVWVTSFNGGCNSADTPWALVDGSQIDPTFGLSLSLPVGPVGDTDFANAGTYCLHVATSASNVGSNPFYFLQHYGSGSNEIEAEGHSAGPNTNNNTTDAEAATLEMSAAGNDAYFVGGDIVGGTEADVFELDVSQIDVTTLNAFGACAGKRIGSGLVDLTMTLIDEDGTTTIATGTETPGSNATLGENGADVPDSSSTIFLEVTASGSDHMGEYYQCGVQFIAP